jgi:hypothetical protein
MTYPPEINTSYSEIDVTFDDTSTTTIYLTNASAEVNNLATQIYDLIGGQSNVAGATLFTWNQTVPYVQQQILAVNVYASSSTPPSAFGETVGPGNSANEVAVNVTLNQAPEADVIVTLTTVPNSGWTLNTPEASALTFTSSNWNVPQEVLATIGGDVNGPFSGPVIAGQVIMASPGWVTNTVTVQLG